MDKLACKVEKLLFGNRGESSNVDLFDNFIRNFEYITKGQFEKFMDLVWKTYEKALIQPGEACGAVAAQSIGEPTT